MASFVVARRKLVGARNEHPNCVSSFLADDGFYPREHDSLGLWRLAHCRLVGRSHLVRKLSRNAYEQGLAGMQRFDAVVDHPLARRMSGVLRCIEHQGAGHGLLLDAPSGPASGLLVSDPILVVVPTAITGVPHGVVLATGPLTQAWVG